MIVQTYTIARNTFVESVRQPFVLILILISGLLQLFNTWNSNFSMGQTDTSEVSGDTKLLFDIGLATVFVVGTLLAGFLATAAMSREIENKTVLTIISKPVSRPVLVLGKYLGVTLAILASMVVMLVFLHMALRHGVMSTTADDLDKPVITFSLLAIFISVSLAGWCNFFYGWNFPQTSVGLLVPLIVVAWFGTLFIDKTWHVQNPLTDLRPQIVLASLCLGLAVLVLCAVALAASTRLGQVATIVVCLAVFVASLLSNYFIGRHVFTNDFVAVVAKSAPDDPERTILPFQLPGDIQRLTLQQAPSRPLAVGDAIFYGPTPNGFPLSTIGNFDRFDGDMSELRNLIGPGVPSAIILTEINGLDLAIRNIGELPVLITEPPGPGDYLFTQPTRVNTVALILWGGIPNMQFYWLLDAVSQNRPVPPAYFGLTILYTFSQVGVFLSLAMILFQRRDVG
jgi:ABC-type transport system involved in multi-copper enzyme maturation permease subunit